MTESQDRLYTVLEGCLRTHEGLRDGRRLALDPVTATVFPVPVRGTPEGTDGAYITMEQVPGFVQGQRAITDAGQFYLEYGCHSIILVRLGTGWCRPAATVAARASVGASRQLLIAA